MIYSKFIVIVTFTALCGCKEESSTSSGTATVAVPQQREIILSDKDTVRIPPTTNKYARELSDNVQNLLTFAAQKESIQIRAKANATLPLEFVQDKGLEPSDGILLEGSRFCWPGCGFDRTSYTIKQITPQFVVIEYTRGIPQQDGYQDSGEFTILYEEKESGASP